MKRSEMREQAFFLAFENLFTANDDLAQLIELYSDNVEQVCDYAIEVSNGITKNKDMLNQTINTYLKSWKFNRLPKVCVAILYVAIYEIKFVDSVPVNVAINEAVELAKKYATNDDAAFINGILGSVAKEG